MTVDLTQGGNTAVNGESVTLTVRWQPASIGGRDVDASAFLLGAGGRVRSDDDMIFYNQPSGAGGAVTTAAAQGGAQSFPINLAALPGDIERIAVALTIHDAGPVSFAQASTVVIEAEGVARYAVDLAGRSESALVLAELYRRNGVWKIRAVGQGFAGGLGPLAQHYGVDIGGGGEEQAAPPPAPTTHRGPPPLSSRGGPPPLPAGGIAVPPPLPNGW